MSVDKFGRRFHRFGNGGRGPPGPGFTLTDDGNYTLENKVLKNIGMPTDDFDACNKTFVESVTNNMLTLNPQTKIFDAKGIQISNVNDPLQMNDAATKRFTLQTLDRFVVELSATVIRTRGDGENTVFDAEMKRISRIALPFDKNDAVNKAYVDDLIKLVQNKINAVIQNIPVMIQSKFVRLDQSLQKQSELNESLEQRVKILSTKIETVLELLKKYKNNHTKFPDKTIININSNE